MRCECNALRGAERGQNRAADSTITEPTATLRHDAWRWPRSLSRPFAGKLGFGTPEPAGQPADASCMILVIVSSTSCATPCNCGVLNIASITVGFKVASTVFPFSW